MFIINYFELWQSQFFPFDNLFCLVNVYAPNFWGYSHEKMPFGGGQFIDMVIYLLSVAWVIENGKFQT